MKKPIFTKEDKQDYLKPIMPLVRAFIPTVICISIIAIGFLICLWMPILIFNYIGLLDYDLSIFLLFLIWVFLGYSYQWFIFRKIIPLLPKWASYS